MVRHSTHQLFSALLATKICNNAAQWNIFLGQSFFADPSLFIAKIYFNDLLTIFIYAFRRTRT